MEGFVVRVAIGFLMGRHIDRTDLEIVMHIFIRAWRQLLQERLHIHNKERLGLIHDDGHGGVQALDVDDAVLYPGGLYLPLDSGGDIDEVERSRGRQFDNVIDDSHMFLI